MIQVRATAARLPRRHAGALLKRARRTLRAARAEASCRASAPAPRPDPCCSTGTSRAGRRSARPASRSASAWYSRVERGVLRPRHRVVRIALRPRILVDDARLRVLLPGQVLELRDAGVGVLVRIVDDRRRLEHWPVERLELEFERAVRQLAEAVVEVLVDRARCRSSRRYGIIVLDLAVVGVEHDLDVRVRRASARTSGCSRAAASPGRCR